MPYRDPAAKRACASRLQKRRIDSEAAVSPTRVDCPVCQRPCRSRKALATHRRRAPECAVSDEARFWERVNKSDECWTWDGGRDPQGYGVFQFDGKAVRATRWLYERLYGNQPDNILICHHCDNPSCVRPDHLFGGTNSDNMIDAAKKGRLPLLKRSARGTWLPS